MSTLWFDVVQASASSMLQDMKVIPYVPHFIWIPCFTVTTCSVPIVVSELMLGIDSKESDSEEDGVDGPKDIIMQDILVDDSGSND